VTVIVPVVPPHEGWVTDTVGVAGNGLAEIVALAADEIHPPELFAVTEYVPIATEENIPVVLV
jgi:hypothetical protein